MNFYADGLTPMQIQVMAEIAPLAIERKFYLGGGTALAIYLRYRRSVYLDWFTAERIPDPLILAQALRDAGLPFETGRIAPGTLHGQIRGLQVSFLEFRTRCWRQRITGKKGE